MTDPWLLLVGLLPDWLLRFGIDAIEAACELWPEDDVEVSA